MNILICGDSWGRGEYYVDTSLKPQFGTDYFLSKIGHNVKNISIGGGSNMNSVNSLKKENLNEYDFIFLFYTNPFRDLWSEFTPRRPWPIPYIQRRDKSLTKNDYIKMYEDCVNNFISNLDKLETIIYLIGGQNKVEERFLKSDYIVNFIPSVREFLYPDFIEDTIVYPNWKMNEILDKFDEEAIEEIYYSKKKTELLPAIHKKYFSEEPYHLDRFGHEVLANHIHNYITSR